MSEQALVITLRRIDEEKWTHRVVVRVIPYETLADDALGIIAAAAAQLWAELESDAAPHDLSSIP